MKKWLPLCVLLLLTYPTQTPAEGIPAGTTQQELVERFGEPTGRIESGGTLYLIFDGVRIKLIDGKAAEENPTFVDQVKKARAIKKRKADYEAAQKAKGLVRHRGEWVTKQELEKAQAMEKQQWIENNKPSVYFIRRSTGQMIDHNPLVMNKKVTVVDFYADWCKPCKEMEPRLNNLMRNYPDVRLNKVNIVQFNSSICEQYGISSIPHIRVLDKDGRLVIPPTNDLEKIEAGIKQAIKQSRPTPPFQFNNEG